MVKFMKKDVDMTNGTLWNKMIVFAIPIALAALMQQLFVSVDMAVVGKFVGSAELAAVGGNNVIIHLLVNLFMGLSVGSNVVISRFIGAGNTGAAKKGVSTSLSLALISGIIIMILGVLLSRQMLIWISSPEDVIDLAAVYLRLYFLGAPFIMLYNFASAILRSRGDTIRPFICLLTGGISNVFLNLLFVLVFHMSVSGVAIATVISNLISATMILYMLSKNGDELSVNLKSMTIDKNIMGKIIGIGLPVGIQSCLFPISNMLVQSSINSLGTIMVAGNAIASTIETYSWNIAGGFDQANITFVSQNYGAGKIDRCRKTVKISLLSNMVLILTFNLIVYLLLDVIIGMFTTDPLVVAVANERLIYMYIVFWIAIVLNVFTAALRGLGYSVVPTIISVMGICVFRIFWVLTVFKMYPSLLSVLSVYPISWGMVAVALMVMYFVVIRKLKKGNKIDLG